MSNGAVVLNGTSQFSETKRLQPSPRLQRLSTDGWEFIAECIAASPLPEVIALHQGSFSFDIPTVAKEAALRAFARTELHQYAPNRGRPSLRKALAESYSPAMGWDIDAEHNVMVTAGANEALQCAIATFVDPGDEVIVIEPFFDQYPNNVAFCGGKAVLVPLTPPPVDGSCSVSSGEWRLEIAKLEAARSPQTKMLVINSPQNPLGKVYSREELEEVGRFCVRHGIIMLSDEVYEHMSFVPFTRLASLSPTIAQLTLTVGSAGKSLFLTGWRLGWLIGPKNLIEPCLKAHLNMCFSCNNALQEALAEVLSSGQCHSIWDQSATEMEARLKRFNVVWKYLGLAYYQPQGTCYVIVDMTPVKIPDFCVPPADSMKWSPDMRMAWFLATYIGVAGVPCSTFTSGPPSCCLPRAAVRFAVGKTFDTIDAAVEKLRELRQYIHVAS